LLEHKIPAIFRTSVSGMKKTGKTENKKKNILIFFKFTRLKTLLSKQFGNSF